MVTADKDNRTPAVSAPPPPPRPPPLSSARLASCSSSVADWSLLLLQPKWSQRTNAKYRSSGSFSLRHDANSSRRLPPDAVHVRAFCPSDDDDDLDLSTDSALSRGDLCVGVLGVARRGGTTSGGLSTIIGRVELRTGSTCIGLHEYGGRSDAFRSLAPTTERACRPSPIRFIINNNCY